MGLLDKVKAQAEQVAAKAQQGVSQGQAKIEEMQAKKQGDALLRDLGAAYFAQQRSGGSAEAVSEALAKVDAHIAEHGAVDTAPTMPTQSTSTPGETGATGASYNMDDM
jgi:hypothetical protein